MSACEKGYLPQSAAYLVLDDRHALLCLARTRARRRGLGAHARGLGVVNLALLLRDRQHLVHLPHSIGARLLRPILLSQMLVGGGLRGGERAGVRFAESRALRRVRVAQLLHAGLDRGHLARARPLSRRPRVLRARAAMEMIKFQREYCTVIRAIKHRLEWLP